MAEFLYKQNQMPAGQIDQLLDLWVSTLTKHNDNPPFADHHDLYHVINSSPFGDVPWQQVWFHNPCEVACNMLTNLTYANEIDYCPYREYSTEGNKCQWKDFMSGNWVWDQADKIAKDPSTLRSTFVPVILGSDKTTVSVGMGNNKYYPLYASIGNIHNNVRRAHCNGVAVIGFLAMPKIMHFRNGHYWCIIYGLGPYIADYEEQVLLACIVRNWCPKYVFHLISDIHQMISPDILHQLIKGAFKDHLMTWVKKYLHQMHNKWKAQKIMDDIDCRIAAVALFSGLQWFPQGCGFKQWTGDDSKALMKVYLPAIEGHVPQDVLVHRNIITKDALLQIKDALSRFHRYHEIFRTTGVVLHFSLPCQHSLMRYVRNI
ncbi:hypothetical protein BDR06DRAFT_984262 [Suillus hirtellus]|nr:hypothetical protein BDR06DRAFT_984262 [Suillus hirtellus]